MRHTHATSRFSHGILDTLDAMPHNTKTGIISTSTLPYRSVHAFSSSSIKPFHKFTSSHSTTKFKSSGNKMEQPKRPLSAYNLIYRFKRSKILEAHENGDGSKEAINRLIMAVPGLEEYPSIVTTMSPKHVKWLRQTGIRSALRDKLSPKDVSNRTHRKSHGCISF